MGCVRLLLKFCFHIDFFAPRCTEFIYYVILTLDLAFSPRLKGKIFLYCFLQRKLLRAPDSSKNSRYGSSGKTGFA
jgi:hypothetical protein